jgi:hypothetical protein
LPEVLCSFRVRLLKRGAKGGGMSTLRFGLAALAAACLLVLVPQGEAQAEGGLGWFHHGKRVKTAYCLRRNYWWFYRPYTTAPEDFPRCEPYFHYLESGYQRRGQQPEPYLK